ncbi:MAG: Rpn family recombination-promoting nuclease/putative transposase [Magnetococcales bacterium]|nr:Rpn family recombination-promoting nuclease/putative transposase [Magnetococcales bacterium]
MKFMDPRIDFAFKKIFGSEDAKDILISFLESLMNLQGDKRIKEITLLNPTLAPRIDGMKESVLDVSCIDHRGVTYIVEMQIRKVRAFLKRIQYNAAKAYVNQIASAEDYPKLNQVIAVTITDFTLFDDISGYVSHHQTVETSSGQPLLREIVYYFIELSKFNKSADSLTTMLDKWIHFIKSAGIMEEIPSCLNESPIRHAFEKALVANMSRKELEYYDKAGMAIADARGAIELALEEGEKKGLQKGLQKGQREGEVRVLRQLLQQKFGPNLSVDIEEKLNKASREEIETWTNTILNARSLDDIFHE